MIKKSCLLVFNSMLIVTGSTQGVLPVTEEVEIDTNTLCAADVVDYTKEVRSLRDQVFTERIAQINTPIELEYNDYVKKHILNLLSNKKQCKKLIERSKDFFPTFKQVFADKGIPEDISSLAIVESHLKVNATSSMGARGLWQFMPQTAKYLGLEVSSVKDERIDVYASTETAAKYLNQLYNRYDDWLLALAAYNCGAGNVNKAIRKSGGKTNFWEIKKFLPRETQNYVPKFIATVYVMNFYQEHDIKVTPKYTQPSEDLGEDIIMEDNSNMVTVLDTEVETVKSKFNPLFSYC